MNRAYVRVSTAEQNEARQIEALKKHDIDIWYTEKISAKNTNRPELQRMLADAQEGDTIFIHDLSRLARSTKDLLIITDDLRERGIHLHSNKENIDTATPTGKLMLTMIGAIAEFERQNLLDRQREGIAIAKRNGAYKNCGRKEKQVDMESIAADYAHVMDGTLTKSMMAIKHGVSRPTLDKILAKVVI